MFIASMKQDFPNDKPMYSDVYVSVNGTAIIVINIIERMMEKGK